ncbi:TIGR04222 domain-containing membrane protein [Nonomuraea sp. NPDC050404]|uniref:TIGR04222 domain-containing membrane protein n=1 Tax=Nonomuraea sp. NPDC050404 TaxID=3155783 RepID=UPI0033EACF4A
MDVVLLLLSFIVALFTAITVGDLRRARRDRDSGEVLPARDGPPPTHYELAYLAGGPDRVADLALALLAGAGAIRLARDGQAHRVVSPPTAARHPIERAVLAFVEARRGAHLFEIRREVRRSPALAELAASLTRLGLLAAQIPRADADLLAWLRWLRTAALAGVALEVPAMLVQRTVWLPLLGMVILVGTRIVAQSELREWGEPGATRVGTWRARQELERARGRHPHRATSATMAVPIALYGLGELPTPADPPEPDAGRSGESGSGGP